MLAPDIILPISSKNKVTFLAHLGTLKLNNCFLLDQGRQKDKLWFELTNLQLCRARVADDIESNEIEAECPIVQPINFNLGKNVFFNIK